MGEALLFLRLAPYVSVYLLDSSLSDLFVSISLVNVRFSFHSSMS